MPEFFLRGLLNNAQDINIIRLIAENRIAEAVRYINAAQDALRLNKTQDFVQGHINVTTRNPLYVFLNNDPRQILTISHDAVARATDIFSQSKESFQAAIHLAAQKGLTDIVRLLLNKAARGGFTDYVNIKDAFGRTPLHYAALAGQEETICFLINAGADTREKEHNRKQDASDLLLREKTYRHDTLEMLAGARYDPQYERALNLAVLLNEERTVKEAMAFDENILAVHHNILIQNALAAGNPALANYLNYAIEINDLRKRYHIFFMQNFENPQEKNHHYFALLKETIDVAQRFNQSPEQCEYNMFATLQLLSLVGGIVSNIDYKSRDNCYRIVPWQNLETLKYSVQILFANEGLQRHFAQQMPQILRSLQVIRENLDHVDDGGNIVPAAFAPAPDFAQNIQPLQIMTDLTADLRIIQKISGFMDFIDEIDITQPFSQDHYALLAMLKQIGEFAKHSAQCRNLSPAIKGLFDEIPWKILEELRDFIAKAVTRSNTKAVYEHLLRTPDATILARIKADIADIANKFRNVNTQIQAEVRRDGWANMAQRYSQNQRHEIMTVQLRQELLQDLQTLIDAEKKANRRARLTQEKAKVAEYFTSGQAVGITNETELKSALFATFFREAAHPLAQKWKDIFQGKNGVFTGIEECFDSFVSPDPAAGANHLDIGYARNTVERILDFIIGDPNIITALKTGPEMADQTDQVQQFLFARMENFAQSPKLRYAVEQLYSELWLTLNKLGPNFEMDENNTKLRNFVEHHNNIFETADKNLANINFLEVVAAVINVEKKIVRHLAPAVPSTVPAISSAGVIYDPQFATAIGK